MHWEHNQHYSWRQLERQQPAISVQHLNLRLISARRQRLPENLFQPEAAAAAEEHCTAIRVAITATVPAVVSPDCPYCC